jgi:protein TonB
MLGVLLESQAQRQRRDGGAAMSVATHVAIIGLVAAATTHVSPSVMDRDPIEVVRIAPPVAPQPTTATPSNSRRGPSVDAPWVRMPQIPAVTAIPPTLPPIDFGAPSDPTPRDPAAGLGQTGLGRLGAVDLLGGDGNPSGSNDWNGTETLMRLLVTARPRYPERLRTAGISGRVRVRFVVDTTGRIVPASVQVVESTHDLFTSAVREVLPGLRFKVAEANGQRVRSLAEMPFEFQITR